MLTRSTHVEFDFLYSESQFVIETAAEHWATKTAYRLDRQVGPLVRGSEP